MPDTAGHSMKPDDILRWLQTNPTLTQLEERFPEERETVRRDLARIVSATTVNEVGTYLNRLVRDERVLEGKVRAGTGDRKTAAALAQQAVITRMAHLAVKQHLVSEATGIDKGKVRFNLLNGMIAQRLLFVRDLERKPVSLFWFRLIWPLLWQRRLLMPLVQPQGIYCFYSRELISELAVLIGGKSCLEIAAGDGTLSRFLRESGVDITATDDYSWSRDVRYPEAVIRQEAREALRQREPEVVLCSWPPAGNPFEHQVFRTKSVQLYIVISSRHRHAAGNREAYEEQTAFEFHEEQRLSQLVLPPELDAAVYLFRRKKRAVE